MALCERAPTPSERGLLTRYNAAILVHHEVPLGESTRSFLGGSIPYLAARTTNTLSLHYLFHRKFRFGAGTSTNPVYSTLPQ